MQLQTISQVSKEYGISTRMLRYYEQIGLIKSLRKEDYSYRVYDALTLKRLQHIIILRKMQIPMKQICIILNNRDAAVTIDIFKKNIAELENEITALSTIKSILNRFVNELEEIAAVHLSLDLLNDDSVLELAESLSLVQRNVKESSTVNDLNKADKQLTKLQDVRIIYLPPMTVASSHFVGENPEYRARKTLDEFVSKSSLLKIKPDLRHIGFENPHNPYGSSQGYEMWVSIPEDMAAPSPLVKKKFHGGIYAAHAAEISNLDHWLALQDWINDNDQYQSDLESIRCAPHTEAMSGYLEEQLNYFSNVQNPDFNGSMMQLDLLLPVKPVESTEAISFDIAGSVEKCGYKAKILIKNKFKVMGFSTFITLDLGNDEAAKTRAMQNFWKELQADGRLDAMQKLKKPEAPLMSFGSYDNECKKHNSWRYTVCLSDTDITDIEAFKEYGLFIKKIDASKWLSFETHKWEEINPHAAAPKLGYIFNGPISGILSVYPNGSTGLVNTNNPKDRDRVVYCLFPVL